VARVSVCLIVKDEATNLPRCLRSVRGVADEIVVVDTGSGDGTADVARAHGARVVSVEWRGDFSFARNAGLEAATGDWILVLDADEELDDASIPELRAAVADAAAEAYWVRIVNYLGQSPDDGLTVENLYPRLFRHRPHYRFEGRIHEQVLPSLVQSGAQVRPSAIAVLHYGYLLPVVAQRGKIERNTVLIEQALRTAPTDAYQWFNLGTEYLRGQRPADAERAYRKTLALLGRSEPRYLSVIVRNLVLALREQRKHGEALQVIRRYQARFPDYTDLVYFEGLACADLFDWDGVEAAMRRALTLGDAPSDRYLVLKGAGTTLPLVWIALAKMERGEEALPDFQAALDALPHDPVALSHLVQRACKSEGPQAALARLRPIVASGRVAAWRVARGLVKAGAYAEALAVLPAEGADDSLVMLFRGECLFRLGRLEDAMESFDRIPRTDPMAFPAGLNRVQTALIMGDAARARSAFTEVQGLQAEGVDALLRTYEAILAVAEDTSHPVELPEADLAIAIPTLRGVLRAALARQATGLVSSLSLLLRLAGLSDGETMCLVGKLAYLEEQYAFAGQCLGRAYALRGLDPEGCMIAAEIHRRAGNFDEALILYHAFVGTGTRGAMSTYMEAASAALKLRRLDDAVGFLDAGLAVYPSATLLGRARERVAAVRDAAAGRVTPAPVHAQV